MWNFSHAESDRFFPSTVNNLRISILLVSLVGRWPRGLPGRMQQKFMAWKLHSEMEIDKIKMWKTETSFSIVLICSLASGGKIENCFSTVARLTISRSQVAGSRSWVYCKFNTISTMSGFDFNSGHFSNLSTPTTATRHSHEYLSTSTRQLFNMRFLTPNN